MKIRISSSVVALAFAVASLAGCGEETSTRSVSEAPNASALAPSDAPTTTEAPVSPAPTTDPVAAHIKVIERRIAANNGKDWNTWESLHTPGAVRTAPGLPGPVVGAPAMRRGIEELLHAFPDYTLTLKDAFGQGDKLVVRIHQTGTMLGPIDFGGALVPPTGKRMEQDWVALVRFEGDLIAQFDEFYDNYELLTQLGLAGN